MEQNKMGVMPVNKLLLSMSLPMMASMLVQALYNIIDSMFVAQLSENALTAVSLAFPAQNLMIAVGTGTGVGVNALVSRSLGEKNKERANLIANNGLVLYVISGIIFAIFGMLGSEIFFRAQTSDPEIIRLGTDYLRVCCLLSTAVFLQFGFERILQATGRTFYTMLTQGLGAIVNIIMDPILIFGLFGAPALGVKGAAIATVFGQVCAATLACWFNKKKNDDIVINPKKYHLQAHAVKSIYAIGVPSICMASIGSIMTFGMNKILIAFTSTAAAVFGVYFKLQSFIFMPVFGMNNGMVPIIGFNYGARKPDRLMKTMHLATKYAMAMMAVGTIIFWAFTPQLLGIFNASEQMLAIGIPALRIISVHFLLAGFNIIRISTFQALGHGVVSLTVSVLRQLFVLLPSAFIFSRIWGLNATWLSFPLAEGVALIIMIFFWHKIFKKEIKPIFDEIAVKETAEA
ncbi:MATE family efflux transporter [Anaerotignum sp.]|nr:MATE family efflux transporter [Anaerotignum sp.]MBQ7757957.1 MATE family efflux transporter [Anaerotignum sp.]